MSLRFTNLLRDLIVESSRFQVLFDKFVKPKERGAKGMMPFEKMTVSSALKKAIHEAVIKLP